MGYVHDVIVGIAEGDCCAERLDVHDVTGAVTKYNFVVDATATADHELVHRITSAVAEGDFLVATRLNFERLPRHGHRCRG